MAQRRAFWDRYGVFPLDHLIVIKDSVIEENPGLPAALYDAFKQAKAIALEKDPHGHIGGTGLKGGDPLPYGLTREPQVARHVPRLLRRPEGHAAPHDDRGAFPARPRLGVATRPAAGSDCRL